MVARRKTWHPPRPPKRRGIRPGMLVICPWCERSGVHVTKKGLIDHTGSDLGAGSPPCQGSGQRVAIGAFGRIVKQSEARNEQAQPGSLPTEATAHEPAAGTETGTSRDDTTDTETSPASSPVCAGREADAPV